MTNEIAERLESSMSRLSYCIEEQLVKSIDQHTAALNRNTEVLEAVVKALEQQELSKSEAAVKVDEGKELLKALHQQELTNQYIKNWIDGHIDDGK